MKTKKQLYKKLDGLSDKFVNIAFLFRELSNSLKYRENELSLKEMESIVKDSKLLKQFEGLK